MKTYFLIILIVAVIALSIQFILFHFPNNVVYNFIFNKKELRRWKCFLQYANDFVYVGTSHDGNHWFELSDEFGHVRYHAIVWKNGVIFDGEASIHPLKDETDDVCSPFIQNYSKKFSKALMNGKSYLNSEKIKI